MDSIFGADISRMLGDAEDAALSVLGVLVEPWTIAQLAVILLALATGLLLGRLVEARLEPRVRAVQGNRRLLRFLALLLRRVRWIVAAALLALAYLALDSVTISSRSVLVGIAALLIASWVLISVASRLIRNRAVSHFVAWSAWIVLALHITGIFDDIALLLDQVALQIGAVRLSAYVILKGIFVVALVLWLSLMVGRFVEARIAANSDLTPSLRVLFGKLVRVGIVVLAGVIALTSLGIDLTALTVFSGALGIGIGFGLQKVVSNFVSGIIILLDRSIKPGDTISLDQTFGSVRSLRSRFVSVITRDGREYLIPNEDFVTQRVVNWSYTDPLVRVDVEFGVAYDSDPHAVRRIAVEAANSVGRVQADPPAVCHLNGFGDSSLDFILRFWIADPYNGLTNVRGQVLLACWDAFKAAGIQIPYPYRQVILDRPVDVRVRSENSSPA